MKKTMIIAMLAIFGLSLFSTTYAGQVNEAGMSWYDDMDEAKAAAEKGDKLIYIYFTGGTRCGWCVKMKKETFSDKEVQKKVLSKYVIVMLNVWENPKQSDKDLMAKFGGRGVPFNVVLNKDLELVKKFSGYKPADAFIKELEELPDTYEELAKLLKKVEKKSGQTYKNFYKLTTLYYDKLGDKANAAKYAEKCLEEDEKNKYKHNAQLNWIVAENYAAKGDADEFKKYGKIVMKLDDKNKEGYYEKVIQLRMVIESTKKEWQKMVDLYDSFVESKMKFHEDNEQTTKF